MADSGIDANSVKTASGVYGGVATPFKVEHATGYLKAIIYNTVLSAPTASVTNSGIDANSVKTSAGLYGTTFKPLMVTNSGGYLRAVNN